MKRLFASTLGVVCLSLSLQAEAKILHHWDFEGETPFDHLSVEGEPPRVVADPKANGNKVMLAVLRPNAKRPERSEVRVDKCLVGQDRWVGARIMRPDRIQNGFTCFFQLGPVSGASGHEGGGLYQLDAYGKSNAHEWTFRGFMERVNGKGWSTKIGNIDFGKWDSWVFHVKLRADKNGLVEVWRNGTSVFQRSGQNAFSGDSIPIKWGVYVGKGSKVKKEINAYYDDITIGDGDSSYAEVAPKHHN